MPYKSEAQRRYFNANREKLEAEGVDVDEWNESSKGKKLPEKKSSVHGLAEKSAELTTRQKRILMGAGLGGLAGGAYDYFTYNENKPEDTIFDGLFAGAGLGGFAGGLYDLHAGSTPPTDQAKMLRNIGRTKETPASPGRLRNPLLEPSTSPNARSLDEVLPSGYRDDAQQYARQYRNTNPVLDVAQENAPFMQDISDTAIDRPVEVVRQTLQDINDDGLVPAATYETLLGEDLRDNTLGIAADKINLGPVDVKSDSLSHELTHASQDTFIPNSRNDLFRPNYARSVEDLLKDEEGPLQAVRTARYLTSPKEEEAYLADIKRNYFRATGKHVRTPADARKVLEWAAKGSYKRDRPGVPLLEAILFENQHLLDPESAQYEPEKYRAFQHWLQGLMNKMPGLVSTAKPTATKVAQQVVRSEKVAANNILATRKEEDEDKRRAGIAPWAATALGAGALGTAYGIAGDKELEDAVQGFRGMDEPLGPNDTMLTRYNEAMSRSANLKPFGMPVSELMPRVRRQGWITGKKPLAPADGKGGMLQGVAGYLGEDSPVTGFLRKGMGFPGYATDTPELFHGARGHYGAFAKGPVAAYAHFLRGEHRNKLKPLFDDFIRNKTQNTLFPDEIDTEYLSVPEQTKLLQEFHASLSPELQAYKVEQETGKMGDMFRSNTENYRPIVENLNKGRNKLKDLGIVAGSSGLGGLTGHSLYRALTDDDEESNLGASLSTAAGMGLGGLGGYYSRTEKGKEQLNKLMSMGRDKVMAVLGLLSSSEKKSLDMNSVISTVLTGENPEERERREKEKQMLERAVARNVRERVARRIAAEKVASAGSPREIASQLVQLEKQSAPDIRKLLSLPVLAGGGAAVGLGAGGMHGLLTHPGYDEQGKRRSRIAHVLRNALTGVGVGGAMGGALAFMPHMPKPTGISQPM